MVDNLFSNVEKDDVLLPKAVDLPIHSSLLESTTLAVGSKFQLDSPSKQQRSTLAESIDNAVSVNPTVVNPINNVLCSSVISVNEPGPPSVPVLEQMVQSSQLKHGQPKRLHVSNIPFRYRESDLQALFGVSWSMCSKRADLTQSL